MKKKYHYARARKIEARSKVSVWQIYIRIIIFIREKIKKLSRVALEWIPLVSTGESISRRHIGIRGCLRTCAYIDMDSDTSRFSRARLIFITSFPLGNSKHILITFFFYGALDLNASKASTFPLSLSFSSSPRFSLRWKIFCPLWPLNSVSTLSPQPFSPTRPTSRESRSQSIQLRRSRVARWIENGSARLPVVFATRYSRRRERNRGDYMHLRKRSLSFSSLRLLLPFLRLQNSRKI